MLIIEDLKTKKKSWHRNSAGSTSVPPPLNFRSARRHNKTPRTGVTKSSWRAPPGIIVMKFGEQLRSSVIREYEWSYLDYDGLKAKLRAASGPVVRSGAAPAGSNGKKAGKASPAALTVPSPSGAKEEREWTEDDEAGFVSALENELEKVHQKQQVKAIEIQRMIAVSEREVNDVVNRLRERGTGEGPSEEEFMLLEEDLSDIIADVHDLAKFVQVNYTGFYKIIKKHDVSSCGFFVTFPCP